MHDCSISISLDSDFIPFDYNSLVILAILQAQE